MKRKQLPVPISNLSLDGLEHVLSSVPKEETCPGQKLVKVIVNVLAYPYPQLDKRADPLKGHELSWVEKVQDRTEAREWMVTPNRKLGMPTMFTMRVLFGLIELAGRHDKTPDVLDIGSLYSFCQLIGVNPDRKNRALVRKHIEILASTTCFSRGVWVAKGQKDRITGSFQILSFAGFKNHSDGNGGIHEKNFVVFHELVRHNLDTQYVKTLDAAFMWSLKTDIAQLLYTHLSNGFHRIQKAGWDYWEVDYVWLVQRMGLKVWSELRRAKDQFRRAHEELINQSYLAKVEWTEGSWKIRYYPGIRFSLGEKLQLTDRKAKIRRTKTQKQQTIMADPVKMIEPIDPLNPLCTKYALGRDITENDLAKCGLQSIEQLDEIAKQRGFVTA